VPDHFQPGEPLGSLERGLAAGYRYAQVHRDDRAQLKTVARARSVADVTASVNAADIGEEVGEPHAFWSGFAHGVAKFLLEDGLGEQGS
jgi:hypothetical protein